MTEDRGQRTEDRGRRTDDRGQRTDSVAVATAKREKYLLVEQEIRYNV